ncbi:DNA cytosine methyltransferase [Brachybacterium sp. EF45031]|uniref:DNA cytosine methyltransferase n=1 Tax=Brachybacterium sillae TaxID=2810536 RepID=UPI00217D081F|nr:DNA cytosine methyltransferase [Brachybacterium sillae]MCS6710806.1 DNA cytosine methyltransferase [Brachybacterium sillae]
MTYNSLELCAGAGGQALGLEEAGFEHSALVELDEHAVQTLRLNRPEWKVIQADLFTWEAPCDLKGVDLLAGGVPCPPFSHAGLQLGEADERNLFDRALEIVETVSPRGVMIENVRGLLDPKFDAYRQKIMSRLEGAGYVAEWRLLNASDYGVPQLRPRSILIALQSQDFANFQWPAGGGEPTTVGGALIDLMASNGWEGASSWAMGADRIAPTLVGGSKKHGGPDLGPTRAKKAWEALGVDARGVANEAPAQGFEGSPRLTVRMAARIQGFPDSWSFVGRKTSAYRQVGNAFPPPVAEAVGRAIRMAFEATDRNANSSTVRAARTSGRAQNAVLVSGGTSEQIVFQL